jgi:hypothetical protein
VETNLLADNWQAILWVLLGLFALRDTRYTLLYDSGSWGLYDLTASARIRLAAVSSSSTYGAFLGLLALRAKKQ